jgi:hypothetical protein
MGYDVFTSFCQCNPVQIPHFMEADHQLIRPLKSSSDTELIQCWRQELDQARFFTAFFCRYSAVTYSIVQHASNSQIQVEYVFAKTWQHIFGRIQQLDDARLNSIVWQNWLVDIAGEYLDHFQIPPVEKINYRLAAVPPPLLCYVEQSLNSMQPLLRLVFMMNNHWHWPVSRIASHLKAEGEQIEDLDLPLYLAESQKAFEKTLPVDLQEIYGAPASTSFDINTSGDIVETHSTHL